MVNIIFLGVRHDFLPLIGESFFYPETTKHILLQEKGKGYETSFYIVFNITSVQANDIHKAFIAFSTSNYTGVEHTHITPLDGNTYSVEDYTYNGKVYRSIKLTSSGGESSTLRVYGFTKISNIIVG